jgi:hypothetical protein
MSLMCWWRIKKIYHNPKTQCHPSIAMTVGMRWAGKSFGGLVSFPEVDLLLLMTAAHSNLQQWWERGGRIRQSRTNLDKISKTSKSLELGFGPRISPTAAITGHQPGPTMFLFSNPRLRPRGIMLKSPESIGQRGMDPI